jgi:transposase
MKSFQVWAPLDPATPSATLAKPLASDHLAFFIYQIVNELDIQAIEDVIQHGDGRGQRPYNPRMMLAILLYGYCVGLTSSRKLETAIREQIPFILLAGGCRPHHTNISEFRRRHLSAFSGLFIQTAQRCIAAGLVGFAHAAIDGTKVEADASRHKAMSYKRMLCSLEKLRCELGELVDQSRRVARGEPLESRPYLSNANDIPREIERRQRRFERILQAKEALELEAKMIRRDELLSHAKSYEHTAAMHSSPKVRKAQATQAAKARKAAEKLDEELKHHKGPPPSGGIPTAEGLPTHKVTATTEGLPAPKTQRNFVDPDSRIMERGGSFIQGYNCQLVVDSVAQVILAQAVTNHPNDAHNLVPMLALTRVVAGGLPRIALADSGYYNDQVLVQTQRLGVEPYVAVKRENHDADGKKSRPLNTAKQALADRLNTPEGKASYRLRKAIVEPVNGQIKEARMFRRFSLRGLLKVAAEWSLVCLVHNLLKLFKAQGTILGISVRAAAA